MADLAEIWQRALPNIRQSVTGVGVWSALNAAVPITLEDDVAYIGMLPEESELSGHLKLPATKRLIEMKLSEVLGRPVSTRIIDGITPHDVELVKRRDVERRRLQQ